MSKGEASPTTQRRAPGIDSAETFRLEVTDDGTTVRARDLSVTDGVQVDALDLSFPDFGEDEDGLPEIEVSKIKAVRAGLEYARFAIHESAASQAIAKATGLRLRVRFLPTGIHFYVELPAGKGRNAGRTRLVLRAALDVDEGRAFVLTFYDFRVFGPLTEPPTAVLRRICGMFSERYAVAEGAGRISVFPHHALLAGWLPSAGWKIPSLDAIDTYRVGLAGDRVYFTVAGPTVRLPPLDEGVNNLAAFEVAEAERLFRDAEVKLASGAVDEAAKEYRKHAHSHPFAAGRLLWICATKKKGRKEARELIAHLLERDAKDPIAINVQACLDLAEGEDAAAAEGFEWLSARSVDEGDLMARVFADVTLGEILGELAPDAAADACESALTLDAGNVDALRALATANQNREDWNGAVNALSALLDRVEDPRQRLDVHLEMAEICLHRLGNHDEAVFHYRQAQEIDADHLPALEGVAQAAAARGDAPSAIKAYDRVVELAQEAGDITRAATAHARIGRLWEEALGRPENAVLRYEKALELEPENRSALQWLWELRAGGIGDRADLLAAGRTLGRALLADGQNTAAADVRAQTAEALLDAGEEPEKVADLYRLALEADPGHAVSLEALADLYEQQGRHDVLAETLALAASRSDDAPTKATLLLRLAAVLGGPLDDAAQAQQALENAAAVALDDPSGEQALALLIELTSGDDQTQALARVWDNSPPGAARARLALRIATIPTPDASAEEARARAAAVEDWFERVIAEDPNNVDAHEGLARYAEERGEADAALSHWETALANAQAAGRRARLHVRLGRLLLRVFRNAEEATRHALAALAEDADQLDAYEVLGRAKLSEEQWLDGAQDLERYAEARYETLDDSERVQLATDLVRAWDGAANLRKTLSWRLRLVELEPGELVNLHAAYAAAEELGEWKQAVDLADKQIEHPDLAGDPERRAALMVRAGKICIEHLKDFARAETYFRAALELQPLGAAFEALVDLLIAAERRWNELLTLYEEHGADGEDRRASPELHRQMARIALEMVGDKSKAVLAFERLLEIEEAEDALEFLADHYRDIHDLSRAASILERLDRVREDAPTDDRIEIKVARAEVAEADSQFRAAADLYGEAAGLAPTSKSIRDSQRRLLSQLGQWLEIVDSLEAEAAVVQDETAVVNLLLEAARVAAQHQGDHERAFELLQRVLETDPGCLPALDALEGLTEEQERWSELADVLERKADLLKNDKSRRANLLRRAGKVAWYKMFDAERAERLLDEVLDLAGNDRVTLEALEDVYRAHGRWLSLADALERRATLETEPENTVGFLREAADIRLNQLDDTGAAVTLLEQATELLPNDTDLRRALISAHERKGDLPAVVGSLRQWAEAETDPPTRAERWLEVARLLRERMADADGAVEAFAAAEAAQPDHPDAFPGRLEALVAAGRAADAAAVLRNRAASATTDGERLDLLRRAAFALEHLAEDPAGARTVHEEILSLSPEDPAARRALARVQAAAGDIAAAIETLRPAAASAKLNAPVTRLLVEYLKRTERFDELYDLYAVRAQSGEDAWPMLEDLAERLDRWTDLAAMRRTVGESVGGLAGARHLLAAARIYRGRVADMDESADCCRAAIAMADEPEIRGEALIGLEDAGDYTTVFDILLRSVSATDDPEQKVSIYRRAAEVAETLLGDSSRAAEALEGLLEIEPGDQLAAGKALSLRTEIQDWAGLANLHERLAHTSEKKAAAEHWRAVAELREEYLNDLPSAAEAFRKALLADPEDESLEARLTQVLGRAGAWDEVAARLRVRADREEGTQRAQTLLELATLRRDRLDDAQGALDALRDAMVAAPDDPTPAAALHEALAKEGKWAEVAELHADKARKLEAGPDAIAGADEIHGMRASAARVLVSRVEDLGAACRVLAEGFNGTDPPGALGAGVALCAELGSYDLLAALYEQALAHPAFENDRLDLLHRLGRLAREQLADPAIAVDAYRRAYDLDPQDAGAFSALRDLYRLGSEWLPLTDLLEQAVQKDGSTEERVELLLELGLVRKDHLSDPEGAQRAFEAAVQLDAGHPQAVAALEDLHRSQANWDALFALYTLRAERAHSDDERSRLYLQAGDLADGALQDPKRAMVAYEAALDCAPDPEPVFERIEDVLTRAGDQERLTDFMVRRAEAVGDAGLAVAKLIEVAQLQLEAGDVDRAAATLLAARSKDPLARAPLVELRKVRKAQEDYLGVDALLAEEEGIAENNEEGAAIARERALLARDVLGEEGRARDHFRRSLELDPSNGQVAADLAALAEKLGDDSAAAFALARLAALGDDSVDAASVLVRAADHLMTLGDAAEAGLRMEEAIAADPSRLQSWEGLVELEARAGRWDEARVLLGEILARASQAGETERTIDVYYRLGVVERRLGHLEAAAARFGRVRLADPDHVEALQHLIEVLRELGEWPKLSEALLEAANQSTSAAEAAAYLTEAARIFDRELASPEAAFNAYQRALDAGADEVQTLRRVADLAFDLAKWDEFLAVFEKLAPKETAPARALSLAWRAGEAFRKKGKAKSAAHQYQRALELDPNHYPSFVALGGLLEDQQDWPRAVAAYEGALRNLPSEQSHRAGPLQARRGTILAERLGDFERAADAFQKALEQSPDDVQLRLRLAGVFAKAKGRTADAMAEYQKVIAEDPFRVECYRELARLYQNSGSLDRAFGMFSILALLDPNDETASAFLDDNQAKIQQGVGQGLMTVLSAADHDELVVHKHGRGALRAALMPMAPGLSVQVYKPPDLTQNAITLDLTSSVALTRAVETLRNGLGVGELQLCVRQAKVEANRASVADLINVASGENPVLLVDETLSGALGDKRAVLFLLGKMLARLRGGHEVFVRIPGREVGQLAQLITRLVAPDFPVEGLDDAQVKTRLRVIKRLVPKKERKRVEDGARQLSRSMPDPVKWVRALQHGENRVGLLVCADVNQAARALLALDPALAGQDLAKAPDPASVLRRSPAIVELLRFASSDSYFELRRRTGLSLDQRIRGQ